MIRLRVGLILFCLLLAWVLLWSTRGTGVIQDDLERNIAIPDELTMPLKLQVAYNDEKIFFRYRWPAEDAHVYHDMLRYEEGEWVRYGSPPIGRDPNNTYEDRVTMLVDDGKVPEFARYGGYITVGANPRYFTDAADASEVRDHPHLGEKRGASDVRKYLPQTRMDVADWRGVKDEETLQQQREAGYFLDLWHWRAGRSNAIAASDDQLIAEHRLGDSGRGPYTTNWDGENNQPAWMFDSEQAGIHALSWRDIQANRFDFDGLYYLAESFAKPFDPDHDWQEGDVIPRRLLREPSGSRGAISVAGGPARWQDGYWDVTLQRELDTGYPLDDKMFQPQGEYTLGIAVHRDSTGSRWHYVSHPYQLGLGRNAEIQAQSFSGDQPDWTGDWTEMTLFYPGQVNWPLLVSDAHAGAPDMAAGKPVKPRHSEEQLAIYGVEMQFNDEIISQWRKTLILGLFLMLGVWFGLDRLLRISRVNKGGEQ